MNQLLQDTSILLLLTITNTIIVPTLRMVLMQRKYWEKKRENHLSEVNSTEEFHR